MKKLLTLIFLMFLCSRGFAQTYPNLYQVQSISVADISSLAAGTHYAISKPLSITSNASFPAGIFLHFTPGGSITAASGVTVDVAGNITADPAEHIFKGSGTVRLMGVSNNEVSVHWWGATGDGATDDSPAIQRCIDSIKVSLRDSVKSYRPIIKFLARSYRIDTPLSVGAGFRYIHLAGTKYSEEFGTTLLGFTGDKSPVIDAVSAHGFILEDLYVYLDTSTIGVMFGYGTLGDAIGVQLRNVYIRGNSDMTTNDNLGTIGILNKSGEHSSYENCVVYANCPVILTNTPNLSAIGGDRATTFVATSSYDAFGTMSCGVHNFLGNNIFVALGGHRPVMVLNNAGYISLGTTYMSYVDVIGTYSVALNCPGSTRNVNASGFNSESIKTLVSGTEVIGWDFNGAFIAPTTGYSTDAVFDLSGGMLGSNFDLFVDCAVATTTVKPWFSFAASGVKMTNSKIVSDNYLDTGLGITADFPKFFSSDFTLSTFSRKTTVDAQHGVESAGNLPVIPAVSSGTISGEPLLYIDAPTVAALGASDLDLDLQIVVASGSHQAVARVRTGGAMTMSAAGVFTPTPFASLVSVVATTSTDVSALSINSISLRLVPNGASGWYVQLAQMVLSGTHASSSPAGGRWRGNVRSSGYGGAYPVFR